MIELHLSVRITNHKGQAMDALTEYRNFIANKKPVFGNHGFAVNPAQVNSLLKPFQRDIVVWAVRKGRAASRMPTLFDFAEMQMELAA